MDLMLRNHKTLDKVFDAVLFAVIISGFMAAIVLLFGGMVELFISDGPDTGYAFNAALCSGLAVALSFFYVNLKSQASSNEENS